jgi:uncharacterized coiled-coil protein SlyX
MTKSQEKDQTIEKINSSITEKTLRKEIEDLQEQLKEAKTIIR